MGSSPPGMFTVVFPQLSQAGHKLTNCAFATFRAQEPCIAKILACIGPQKLQALWELGYTGPP